MLNLGQEPNMANCQLRLVIGYGNTLRSDDGIGQWVAQQVEKWQLPHVRSLSMFQLTPELAEEISQAKLAIFVDAAADLDENQPDVRVQSLEPQDTGIGLGHLGDPRSLLYLSQTLYDRVPPAYWILIRGVNFEFGESLSPKVQKASLVALDKIWKIVTD